MNLWIWKSQNVTDKNASSFLSILNEQSWDQIVEKYSKTKEISLSFFLIDCTPKTEKTWCEGVLIFFLTCRDQGISSIIIIPRLQHWINVSFSSINILWSLVMIVCICQANLSSRKWLSIWRHLYDVRGSYEKHIGCVKELFWEKNTIEFMVFSCEYFTDVNWLVKCLLTDGLIQLNRSLKVHWDISTWLNSFDLPVRTFRM